MKYIDAEKLKERVTRLIASARQNDWPIAEDYLRRVIDIINSLQQEQPDFPTTDEQMKEFLATHPKVEVPEKYKNPDWLFKKQEQSEVFDTVAFQKGVQEGRRLEREDALTIADIEKFRREAEKDFTVALVSSGSGLNPKTIAYAIEMADELIKQLKEK